MTVQRPWKRNVIRLVVPTVLVIGLYQIWMHFVFGHAPGGFVTNWCLEDGTRVRFHQRSHELSPHETVKVLEVTPPNKPRRRFRFAERHAGYNFVELRMNGDRSAIWIVDTNSRKVGCSLNLRTGDFVDEGAEHPLGVDPAGGVRVRPSWWP